MESGIENQILEGTNIEELLNEFNLKIKKALVIHLPKKEKI
ncbi:hypothetical protein [Peribacillus frigoritolerans]|nr:hypothetical protein [Peribacillus frigoritolerans]